MHSTADQQVLDKNKQENLAHLRIMLELPQTDPKYKQYLGARSTYGISTYSPINNFLKAGSMGQTAKKTIVNALFFEEQIMDIFASNNLEQDTQERISMSGVLLDRHGAACENIFMQSVNGLQYFSTLIQVASAMAELQCQYAQDNGILGTSQCEFTINNMKYMLGNPHCMLLGAGLGEQKMSVFVYEEALRRLCPPQPSVGDENYEATLLQIKKITDLAEQTRLLYHLTFHIDCRQKMRRLNKELRLGDGFNQIVGPFLLEAFSKIVAESQQSLPANVGAIGETLASLDNLMCGGTAAVA